MLNIVTSIDSSYCPHLAAMLSSLCSIHVKGELRIFVLIHGVSSEDQKKIALICKEYHNSIHFISVEPQRFSGVRIDEHISIVTYFRLIIDELIDPSIERIIYIDADTIVCQKLSDLELIDLKGLILAAVVDPGDECWTKDKIANLGLNNFADYFNAGVMVIDMKAWRKKRMGAKTLYFAQNFPHLTLSWDQDALNYVLSGEWYRLPLAYNVQTHFIKGRIPVGNEISEVDAALAAPIIVHYNTADKPWVYWSNHYFKNYYWQSLRTTPYHNTKPTKKTIMGFIRRKLPHYLPDIIRTPARIIFRRLMSACPNLFAD
jgi:lipopolysaccharide biosynthesis glycosyltransferase